MAVVSGVGGLVGGGGGFAGATFGSISMTASQMRYMQLAGLAATSVIPGIGAYRLYKAGKVSWAVAVAVGDVVSVGMAYRYIRSSSGSPGVQPGTGGTPSQPGMVGGTGSALGYAAKIARGGRRLEWPEVRA